MIIRDTFTEQLTPHQIDVGHLSENPTGWEERYERKNLKTQRFQGKVKLSLKWIFFFQFVFEIAFFVCSLFIYLLAGKMGRSKRQFW